MVSLDNQWASVSDSDCGSVGFENAGAPERATVIEFLLPEVPEGAHPVRATLAIHDATPDAAGRLSVTGYTGQGSYGGPPPTAPTGSILVTPTPSAGRDSWDVSALVTEDSLELGLVGFWLRLEPDVIGLHRFTCTGTTLGPILTVEYVGDPDPGPVAGQLRLGGDLVTSNELRKAGEDDGWGFPTSWLCGDVGRDVASGMEARLAVGFKLAGLPSGAIVTGATLALYDGNPGAPGAVAIEGYMSPGMTFADGLRDGEPLEPTGRVVIRPSGGDREIWVVDAIVTPPMVAGGRADFLLRAADETDGLHEFACAREPKFPILTLSYRVEDATPTTQASPHEVLAPESWMATLGDTLRVRSQPRISDDSKMYEPLLPKGTNFSIISGPVFASGYWWYRVELAAGVLHGGITQGWVAEGDHDGTPWIKNIGID